MQVHASKMAGEVKMKIMWQILNDHKIPEKETEKIKNLLINKTGIFHYENHACEF